MTNRHERRRLAKLGKVGRVETVSPADLANMGVMCGGADCGEHFDGDLPPGWVWLVTHASPKPELRLDVNTIKQDKALCPHCAAAVDAVLKSPPGNFDTRGNA